MHPWMSGRPINTNQYDHPPGGTIAQIHAPKWGTLVRGDTRLLSSARRYSGIVFPLGSHFTLGGGWSK